MSDLERVKAENDALREMFQTPGWAVLMRNTKAQMEGFRAGFPGNVRDNDTLQFARGLFAALDQIINMPEYLEMAEQAALQVAPEEE